MSKYTGYSIAQIGTNGTGKTTWMNNVIMGYPKEVLVLMDDDSEDSFDWLDEIPPDKVGMFKGKGVCYVEDDNKEKDMVFTNIYEGFTKSRGIFKGGLICIDDAMTILDAQVRKPAKNIFKKRRQRRFDIILNCHGASEFPISLFKNMTHFQIFKTLDSYENIAGRMNKQMAEQFIKCINYVNNEASKNPYFNMFFDLKNPPNIG